jgi:hypothetical protein
MDLFKYTPGLRQKTNCYVKEIIWIVLTWVLPISQSLTLLKGIRLVEGFH